MALTKATPEVIDIPKISVALAGDSTVSGIKAYIDNKQSASIPITASNNYSIPSNGSSYIIFVDTTANSVIVDLPVNPVAGNYHTFMDLSSTFSNINKLTVGRNGEKIQGLLENMDVTVTNASFDIVYSGSQHGWLVK